jgi:hypothetical protein
MACRRLRRVSLTRVWATSRTTGSVASWSSSGTLAQWREWTGLPFDRDGQVTMPGALTPVHVSLAHDHAVYVEPNVWVRHRVTMAPSSGTS